MSATACRSSDPSAATIASPNRSRIAANTGVPGCWSSRVIASASITSGPSLREERRDRGLAGADPAGETDEDHGGTVARLSPPLVRQRRRLPDTGCPVAYADRAVCAAPRVGLCVDPRDSHGGAVAIEVRADGDPGRAAGEGPVGVAGRHFAPGDPAPDPRSAASIGRRRLRRPANPTATPQRDAGRAGVVADRHPRPVRPGDPRHPLGHHGRLAAPRQPGAAGRRRGPDRRVGRPARLHALPHRPPAPVPGRPEQPARRARGGRVSRSSPSSPPATGPRPSPSRC